MKFRTFDSAAEFLEVAGPFLRAQESLNSLLLGLAERTVRGTDSRDEGTRFFAVEDGGGVVGVSMQSPNYPVLLARMSEAAAQLCASELPSHLETLKGCNGPKETAEVVARSWREQGLGELQVEVETRLFEVTELTPPRPTTGRMRLAVESDFETCQRWSLRFVIDCNLLGGRSAELPKRVLSLEEQRLYLWEDEGMPVACAAWQRPLENSVNIGYVYTPDDKRGRGYASNVVATLTAGLLDGSLYQPARRFVNLFTDLANPTSNSIYSKMGYQPICDFRAYEFQADQES